MLIQRALIGDDRDVVAHSIAVLRMFEPPDGYYLAFSGGKDSQVLYHLAQEAGVRFEAHYAVTTVDPPELMRFIRAQYPDVIWDRPERGMYRLIVEHGMPPTRMIRYCCRALKEDKGVGRVVTTGIRAEESRARAGRQEIEACRTYSKRYVHPILNWTAQDVWDYHRSRGLEHCQLYDEGFERIGCVLCPMAGRAQKKVGIARWPTIVAMYRRACEAAYARRAARGDEMIWHSGEEMFWWWVSRDNVDKGQLDLGLFG